MVKGNFDDTFLARFIHQLACGYGPVAEHLIIKLVDFSPSFLCHIKY